LADLSFTQSDQIHKEFVPSQFVLTQKKSDDLINKSSGRQR